MQIHVFAFALFFQSFLACQQTPENALSLAAGSLSQNVSNEQQAPGNARASTTGIIFRSTDGGQSWQDVSVGLPEKMAVSCVFSTDGEVFIGSESGLYRRGVSPIAGAWKKEFFPNEKISTIFPGRAGFFVSSFDNQFFQETLPGTGTWMPQFANLKDKMVRTVLETPDGTVFIGCDNGIFKSTDNGQSWKQVFAEDMVRDLVFTEGVLAGSGSEGVLRSTDGGEHWDWVLTEAGLAQKTGILGNRLVAISRQLPEQLKRNALDMGSTIHTSADGGQSWQPIEGPQLIYQVGKGLTPIRDIYDVQQLGESLFCSCDAGLFRSVNQGKSWKLVLALPYTDNPQRFDFTISGQVIYAVSVFSGC